MQQKLPSDLKEKAGGLLSVASHFFWTSFLLVWLKGGAHRGCWIMGWLPFLCRSSCPSPLRQSSSWLLTAAKFCLPGAQLGPTWREERGINLCFAPSLHLLPSSPHFPLHLCLPLTILTRICCLKFYLILIRKGLRLPLAFSPKALGKTLVLSLLLVPLAASCCQSMQTIWKNGNWWQVLWSLVCVLYSVQHSAIDLMGSVVAELTQYPPGLGSDTYSCLNR